MTCGPRPQGRGEIKGLLAAHGLRPRKALGQHFLADPNLVDRIVRLAGVGPGDRVLEIGAGTGTLTRALAATGADVLAYEVDPRLEPLLVETVGDLPNVEVRLADATDELPDRLGPGPWVVVANLPYHVGTPLLLDLLRHAPQVTRFVVMVQREVADRLAAPPGSSEYGLPSVVVGLHAEVGERFSVPPQVFVPPPEVESAVIELMRKPAPPEAEAAIDLATVAFSQRRKMLRRSLAGRLEDAERVLHAAGIEPTARPETVGPQGWVALARAVASEETQ